MGLISPFLVGGWGPTDVWARAEEWQESLSTLQPLLSHPGVSPNFPSPHPPSLSLASGASQLCCSFFFTCPSPAVDFVLFLLDFYPRSHPKNNALGKSHRSSSQAANEMLEIKGFTIIFSLSQSSSILFPLKMAPGGSSGMRIWDEETER